MALSVVHTSDKANYVTKSLSLSVLTAIFPGEPGLVFYWS